MSWWVGLTPDEFYPRVKDVEAPRMRSEKRSFDWVGAELMRGNWEPRRPKRLNPEYVDQIRLDDERLPREVTPPCDSH